MLKSFATPLTCLAIVASHLLVHPATGAVVRVDLSRPKGTIRPLHGVNLGPLCYRGTVDLSEYHRELAIPYTRLHDVVWLNADAVDVSTIFRNALNDPTQVGSYDFRATDDYIQAIVNVGSGIVYRLGESIEHTPRKYRVHPPTNPQHWAAVCLGIIRHYNQGWADGFHHHIQYWEIWNEPDVRPAMWTGTDEQFFELYSVTAKTIKMAYPNLKVGGPALGHVGDFKDNHFHPSPFFTNFLNHCRHTSTPLDFLSWHRYTADPADPPRLARAVRETLDAFGFTTAESHFNEWNYLPDNNWQPMLRDGQGAPRAEWYRRMGGPEGAAFAACVLIDLQDAPVDVANFYTGEIQGFGLFYIHGVPKKTFYSFKAFRALLHTPSRVAVELDGNGHLRACAGLDSDHTRITVLIANFNDPDPNLQLEFSPAPTNSLHFQVHRLDLDRNLDLDQQGLLAPGQSSLSLHLPSPGVTLVQLTPKPQSTQQAK